MPLKIDVVPGNAGIVRVLLSGRLDSETAPQLETALASTDALLVVLDMEGLTFISSAGLRVIFASQRRQQARKGELVFTNMGPGIKRVFEIVKALPSMSVFASMAEMDEYLATFQKRQG